MIRLDGVCVRRSETLILDRLNLELDERRIGVIGANGSGKSTFARLLNGLILPSAGTVTVDGLDTKAKTKEVRRRVGFVFQNPDNQIVYPTVGEDIAFGLTARKWSKADIRARLDHIFQRYDLSGLEDRLVHELSGGERQMVAFAGVMALEPEWIVLDEPTTLLDRRNTNRVMRTIAEVSQNIVFVTHDLDRLTGFDRVLVFETGRLAFDGPPAKAIPFYMNLTT
ncbi:ABC transporter, ATP-binding protein [Fulvimarina pelagi HTCC2506]|uniref:ABC transporter, ATP-binding protein n=2 Tax=Fulvimarina pelagi TaxID=217511 RepID=Q0FYB3_9HYPH|nr:ABC transporter ATP-binding protein [Fulvimarina pelagi]EAU40082.1 ABC transporter, ATP-binding protein [Fulvimarina pelagi HTCC2506]BAT31121.1 ABC transporter, ATP-binding protein [Fulvimarina pelagi]